MKFRTPFIYLHFFLLSLLICTIFAEYFCGGIVDFINITIAIFFVILIIFPDFRVIELAEKGCIVRLFNIRKKLDGKIWYTFIGMLFQQGQILLKAYFFLLNYVEKAEKK